MRDLKIDYWGEFIRPDGSFEGRLFETLVQRMLNLHFGGGWRITKVSWDGGKDVVSEEVHTSSTGKPIITKSWAECKIHRKPVPLRLVSNTLVMAVVDEAKRLVLFSYSPIIDNARFHLTRFSAATRIAVEIIDDELLEQLILRHIDDLRGVFFPTLPIDFRWEASARELQLTARLTRDVDTDPLRLGEDEDPEARPDAHTRTLNLRSLLRIQLAVRNPRLDKSSKVTVTIEGAEPLSSPFELVNTEARASDAAVQPCGLALFEFYLRPNQGGQGLQLPRFKITDDNRLLPRVNLGCVNVRSLLLPPLLGGRFHEFIARFRDHVSLRTKPVFAAISGRAGVGKTRLTSELVVTLLSKGIEVHRFNGDSRQGGSFATFARQLLAKLYRLPNFPIKISNPISYVDEPGSIGLQRLLYDDNINPANHADELLNLVQRAVGSRGVAMIVDNVQYLDPPTVDFLAALVHAYHDTASRFVGVFVFNIDFLELNEHAALFRDLFDELRQPDPEHVLDCVLSDLSIDEVNLFLDHLISVERGRFERGFTSRFPELAGLLRAKIVPRPLDLLQTMFYLVDESALYRRDDVLFVDDIDRFHDALQSIPPELKGLLARRWRRILEARPGLETAARLLAALRTIRAEDAECLGLADADRELLINLGLGKENDLGELAFFHESIERFFSEHYSRIEAPLAKELVAHLEQSGLDDKYFPSYLIASAQAGLVDGALVARATRFLGLGLPSNSLNVAFGQQLLTLIRRHCRALEPAEELRAVHTLAMLVSAPRGLSYRLKIFDQEVAERKSHLDRYKTAGPTFASLLREHASHHFAVQADSRALVLLLECEQLLDELDFASLESKEKSRAAILNRLCVAYKSLADKEAALAAGHASLEIAERLGIHDLVFLNHVDLGYVFYGSIPPSSQLFCNWRKAVLYFDSHESEITAKATDNAACANLVRSHLLLLEGRYREAGEINDLWTTRCMRQMDAFYAVGFMMLQIVRQLLIARERIQPTILRALVDRAIDTCEAYKINRGYWKALHARAKVELMAGTAARAMDAYAASLHQLLKVTVEANEPLYRFFFEDMAITARQLRSPLPEGASLVRSAAIRQRMRDIVDLSDSEFSAFLARYRPCSTFNDGVSNFPCP